MEYILELFLGLSPLYIYLMIMLLLIAGAFGFPFPEDLVFISVGYMSYLGLIDPFIALAMGFIAVLMSDTIIYFIGYKLGPKIFSIPVLNRLITEPRLESAKKLLNKHGSKFVFFSKFVVGFRYSVFFTSGALSIGYLRFIIFDALASSISAPLLVYLAFQNGENIDALLSYVKKAEYIILVLALLVIAYFLVRAYYKKSKKNKTKNFKIEDLQKLKKDIEKH
jgi:membrane protein DedA with SNARE-associated domain